MKNSDKEELGLRLWRYFRSAGCSVEVAAAEGRYGRECRVQVRRVSPWTGKAFQKVSDMVEWKSPNANDSFGKTARYFAEWWCGGGCVGWGAVSEDARAEFVSARSLEELDLKLSSRGF